MRAMLYISAVMIVSILLSGCMYPQDKRVENQIPYEDQIQAVQMAVDKYREATGGLLPIKTRDIDTPIYIKYPVEFSKIAPQYLSSPPGNAYESGGVFQYVLIDVETNPTVKVFDLRIAEKIREIKIRIKSQGYPPFKETIADNVYSLDYKQIGYKTEPYVISPYTNNNLPFIITGQGEVYVDYISDLYAELKKSETSFTKGDDIRGILSEHHSVVPAYSIPYTIDDHNEPVYMAK